MNEIRQKAAIRIIYAIYRKNPYDLPYDGMDLWRNPRINFKP